MQNNSSYNATIDHENRTNGLRLHRKIRLMEYAQPAHIAHPVSVYLGQELPFSFRWGLPKSGRFGKIYLKIGNQEFLLRIFLVNPQEPVELPAPFLPGKHPLKIRALPHQINIYQVDSLQKTILTVTQLEFKTSLPLGKSSILEVFAGTSPQPTNEGGATIGLSRQYDSHSNTKNP